MSLDVNVSELEEFNSIELHNSIKNVALLKGVDEFEYHVEFISSPVGYFIANIFRVIISESGKEGDVSVIVKTLINTSRQEQFRELHEREVIVYKEVMPKFKEIQNILKFEDKVIFPDCLYTSTDKGSEVLILEDLQLDGFEVDDKLAKFENLDFAQVRLALVELAKFHALSIIYEKMDPENFSRIKSRFHDIMFVENFLIKSKLGIYFLDSFEMSLQVIEDLNARKKLETIKDKILHTLKVYLQPGKYNVLCHGDFWINNIMFKNKGDKHRKVCFFDFQAMRYASPVTDIIYFLFVCTTSEFRTKYFEELQHAYYDNFRLYLSFYDIDSNSVYPREDFENEIKEFLPMGLLIALLELRIVTISPEDEEKFKYKVNLESCGINEDYLYKIRVNDVVNECVENDILDKLIEKIND